MRTQNMIHYVIVILGFFALCSAVPSICHGAPPFSVEVKGMQVVADRYGEEEDFSPFAKSKGVSKVSLIWKHVIRNAILPAITLLGPQIANIFTGSFVIESIFAIPGLGQYFVSSINDRDYPMVMGQTIFISFLFIFSLFVVDIVYGLVDPRIRVSGGKK